MGPTEPRPLGQGDVAAGIVSQFEAEASRAETKRRAARLMIDAVHGALGRAMAALTVVNLREWCERRRC